MQRCILEQPGAATKMTSQEGDKVSLTKVPSEFYSVSSMYLLHRNRSVKRDVPAHSVE